MKRLNHFILPLCFLFLTSSSLFGQLENLALDKPANQSSTYGLGLASIAVDGDVDGTRGPWANASIQHTQNEFQPWWEVDLGSSQEITSVKIYNRTDGFSNRLQDFYILISDIPFSSGGTLDDFLANPSITKEFYKGSPGAEWETSLNTTGRYVRVQLRKQGILHMAEVEVLGEANTSESCPEAEILMDFFEATDGENWRFDLGWGEGCPCENSWQGVECNESGKVTFIFLSSVNIRGPIPESFSKLEELEVLDLGFNQISALPNSIGEMDKLFVLGLGYNSLTELPESIGDMESLAFIDAQSNQLTGLPSSLTNLSNLIFLGFSSSSGIPPIVGELDQLENLIITESGLTDLPNFISNLVNLERLDLQGNQFSSLPDFISTFSQLRRLELRDNQFSTPPEVVVDLENLTSLDLWENPFSCFPNSYEVLCQRNVRVSADDRNAFRSFCETGVYACEEEGCTGQENFALGKATAQSSTYGQGVASIAVDGDTDGSRGPWGKNPSIQHTQNEFQPWWEVDLGEGILINAIKIVNRSTFQSRLKSFRIFLSNQPFNPEAGIEELESDPNVRPLGFIFGDRELIDLRFEDFWRDLLDDPFRYIRIQLPGDGILHMAEVEVFGCSIESSSSLRLGSVQEEATQPSREVPSLYPNPAKTSFTLALPASYGPSSKISVLNALGQVIESRVLGEASNLKLGAAWASGIYSIEIRSGEQVETLKLVKQ